MTCTEPLSLAVGQLLPWQFLEMVRFAPAQRARLAELPEELVRGQMFSYYPHSGSPEVVLE
jgi:hypothetical protein